MIANIVRSLCDQERGDEKRNLVSYQFLFCELTMDFSDDVAHVSVNL